MILAFLISLLPLFFDRILKGACKHWKYADFARAQKRGRFLIIIGLTYTVPFLFGNYVLRIQFPLWVDLEVLVAAIPMLFGVLLIDFYSPIGTAVLKLRLFLLEAEKESEGADIHRSYGKLLLAFRKVNEIAKEYNMEVSPYALSLGMTISFLEDEGITRIQINDLIKWIEAPAKTENFKKFKKIVKNYSYIAELSTMEGISQKHYWYLEKRVELIALATLVATLAPTINQIVHSLLNF